MATKQCVKCLAVKPETDFYKREVGRFRSCKVCFRTQQNAARHENIEAVRASGRAYQKRLRQSNPERFTAEARRSQRRGEYARNRPKLIDQSRRWRAAHPGATWKQVTAWIAKSPENADRYRLIRRVGMQRRRAAGDISTDQFLGILESQEWRCAYCSCDLKTRKYHLEHRTPVSRGGLSTVTNVCASCVRCNARKHDKTAEEFLSLSM